MRQCFKEAGLADGYGEDVVAWWDRLAGRFRGAKDYQYTEIGRRGERLSFDHEYSWTARNGNHCPPVAAKFNNAVFNLRKRHHAHHLITAVMQAPVRQCFIVMVNR